MRKKSLQLILCKIRRITAGHHPQKRRPAVIGQVRPGHAGRLPKTAWATDEAIIRLQSATHTFPALHTDTTQEGTGEKTTGHRHVRVLAAAGKAHMHTLPLAQRQTRPQRLRLRIERERHLRATHRKPGIDLGLQFDAAQRDFQYGRCPGIVQQPIGPSRRVHVHRPGR